MLEAKYGKSTNGFPTAQPSAVSQSFNEKLNSYLHKPAFDMGQNKSGVVGTGLKSAVNSTKSLVANTKAIADFAHLDPIAYPDQVKELSSVPGQLWETAKSQVDANVAQKLADDGIDRVLQKIEEKRAKGEDTSHLENYLKQPGVVQDTKAQGTITQILNELGKSGVRNSLPQVTFAGVEGYQQAKGQGESTGQAILEGVRTSTQSIAQDPFQLLPLFLIAKGVAGKKMFLVKDPLTGKPVLDAKGNPTYKSALETKVGEKIDKGISKVADIATKPLAVPAKGAIKVGKALARYGASQTTGLSPKTIETIINDPKAFSKTEAAQYTREGIASEVKKTLDERITDLSELGKGYESIRSSAAKVDLSIETVGEILNKYKIDVDANGRVRTTQESLPMSQGDISALQNFIDIFNTPRLSANAFLNARTALSNMAKFDTTRTNASTTFARELRSAYDKAGKEQIPGLKELDSVFSVERTALQKIKRDYLNADGTFKDSAVSKIANLNRAGREQVLGRLEAILPGIGKKIAILNALEDIANAQGQKVGAYGRAALGGAGLVSGNLFVIVGAILSSPSIAAQILRGYGKLKGIKKEVIEQTIKKVEQILTSDVGDLTKKAKIGLSIEDASTKGKKPNSTNPLDDTGSAAKNRLNKYEAEALKKAKAKPTTESVWYEKDGRNLMEWENGDLSLAELKNKLKVAIEGKEDVDLINMIKKDITTRTK